MRSVPLRSALVLAALLAAALAASAKPVIYTFKTTATGTLDGVAFGNAPLTLTASGITDLVSVYPDYYSSPLLSVLVTVAGVGEDYLTDTLPLRIVSGRTSGFAVSLSTITRNLDIFSVANASLPSYNLMTTTGPVDCAWRPTTNTAFLTTRGALQIASTGNVTFAAAVPEPPAFAALGLGAVAVLRRRRA